MSGCDKVQELISRMIDEDLNPLEDALLAEHLETCASCRAVYAAFSALSGALSEELEEPPRALRANVMADIRRAEIRKKNRRHRGVYTTVAAAAAIAVIIGASFAVTPLFRGGKAGGAAVYDSAYPAEAPAAAYSLPEEDTEEEAVVTGGGTQDSGAGLPVAAAMEDIEEEAMDGTAPENNAAPSVQQPAPVPETAPSAGSSSPAAYQSAGDSAGTVIVEAERDDGEEEGDSLVYIQVAEGRRQDQLLGLLEGKVRAISADAEPKEKESLPLKELPELPVYVLELDGEEPRRLSVYIWQDKVYFAEDGEEEARLAKCTVKELRDLFE